MSQAEQDVKLNDFPNIFRLDGKVAVVTGGSRGLGLHAASGYANSKPSAPQFPSIRTPLPPNHSSPLLTNHTQPPSSRRHKALHHVPQRQSVSRSLRCAEPPPQPTARRNRNPHRSRQQQTQRN